MPKVYYLHGPNSRIYSISVQEMEDLLGALNYEMEEYWDKDGPGYERVRKLRDKLEEIKNTSY